MPTSYKGGAVIGDFRPDYPRSCSLIAMQRAQMMTRRIPLITPTLVLAALVIFSWPGCQISAFMIGRRYGMAKFGVSSQLPWVISP